MDWNPNFKTCLCMVLQEQLAATHGTQCGFCSPGFVMAMYSLLQKQPEPTVQKMESTLSGNICRCTGYRPILQGMSAFCRVSSRKRIPASQPQPSREDFQDSFKFVIQAFGVVGPKVWNGLPLSMRQLSSLSPFKRALKTHLFRDCCETL